MVVKMGEELWQPLSTQSFNALLMRLETWQPHGQHILKLILFLHQGTQKPKCSNFSCVKEQNGCDKIHTLHITDRGLVVGEGYEDPLEALMNVCTSKVLNVLECTFQVLFDVLFNLDDLFISS